VATLERCGILPSYSRPRVSDDNPYSEALFRTQKARPEYPSGAFGSLDGARGWVEGFVGWYNEEHRHSSMKHVTPAQRHDGEHIAILMGRREVYEQARKNNPGRWSGQVRNWEPAGMVLSPTAPQKRTCQYERSA
jgi:hypothetical protein